MAISKFKRRYTVTLTPGNVARFQALCKEFGLPQTTMSYAIDEHIAEMCGFFQTAKEKGSLSIEDLFAVLGTQMQLLIEEEKKKDATHRNNEA